jgi:hypothetical protein
MHNSASRDSCVHLIAHFLQVMSARIQPAKGIVNHLGMCCRMLK